MKLLVLTVSLLVLDTIGFSRNLVSCEIDSPSFKAGCSLESADLSSPLYFGDEPILTEYHVEYDFSCQGHRVTSLGIKSGDGFSPFIQGTRSGNLIVKGKSVLETFDSDPSRSFETMTFVGSCHLEVLSIVKFVDETVLDTWGSQARMHGQIIDLATDTVNLAKGIETIETYSRDEFLRLREMVWEYLDESLFDMGVDDGIYAFAQEDFVLYTVSKMRELGIYDRWNEILNDDYELRALVKVLEYANSNLNVSSPIVQPISSAEKMSSKRALSRYYRKNLRSALNEARIFLVKIEEIIEYIDDTTRQSLESLKALVNEG